MYVKKFLLRINCFELVLFVLIKMLFCKLVLFDFKSIFIKYNI